MFIACTLPSVKIKSKGIEELLTPSLTSVKGLPPLSKRSMVERRSMERKEKKSQCAEAGEKKKKRLLEARFCKEQHSLGFPAKRQGVSDTIAGLF